MGVVNVGAAVDCWCGNAIAIITRYVLIYIMFCRFDYADDRLATLYWVWVLYLVLVRETTTVTLASVEDFLE